MKTFEFNGCIADLSQFGVHSLTGEACALGCRVLCDLTRTGVKVIEATFGMPSICGNTPGNRYPSFAENWNHGSDRDPHVASVMLFPSMARGVAIVGMFEVHKCESVMLFGSGDGYRCMMDVQGLRLDEGETFADIQAHVAQYAGQYEWDEARQEYVTVKEASLGYQRSITPINQPRRGLQCVHAMTGRSL